MNRSGNPARHIVGVGAVVWNDRRQVLLIRRANPPRQHEWSLPGGKVEFGETLRAALGREVREETGLAIEILDLIDVAELIHDEPAGAAGAHYVLIDFSARALSEKAVAASDAAEARWFSIDEIADLQLWSETRRVIALSADRILRRAKPRTAP
ncbi:MAG TPA: NUDIX hydrolase [Rhizomicrobium sp.]